MAEGGALKAPCSLQGLDRDLCRDSSPLSSEQVGTEQFGVLAKGPQPSERLERVLSQVWALAGWSAAPHKAGAQGH